MARQPEGPSVIVAFSVTPLGAGDSVGDLVADCVRIVRASGLPNETNAMFTNVEGEWDQVMPVVRACVDHVAERAPRVSVVVKIDHRVGDPGGRLASKRERVEQALEDRSAATAAPGGS
ncbi:MAG TPA: MTH1187 family thiamine-binding protein [Nitriliruptorales bacterium]